MNLILMIKNYFLIFRKKRMSLSSAMKHHQTINIQDVGIHPSSSYSSDEILLSKQIHDDSSTSSLTDSSSSSNEFPSQQIPNRRVVKSCFWSTMIFSINFISSILVINLSKWYDENL